MREGSHTASTRGTAAAAAYDAMEPGFLDLASERWSYSAFGGKGMLARNVKKNKKKKFKLLLKPFSNCYFHCHMDLSTTNYC